MVSFSKRIVARGNARRVASLLHQLAHLDKSIIRLPRQLTLQVTKSATLTMRGGSETHRRTDDDPHWTFTLDERDTLLLLEREHEQGQREGERLSRSSEGDSNHVAAREPAARVVSIHLGA